MLKRLCLLFITGAFFLSANSQQAPAKYLTHYIKVWGFLKYYHPSIGSGKADADSLFILYAGKVGHVRDDKTYRDLLLDLQESLGVATGKIMRDTTRLFTKNDRTGWISRDKLLPAKVKQQLLWLRNQGYTGSIHQYMPANFFETEIPAEKKYDSLQFPNVDYQLLALSRYWNAVEYLFAYKYMISKNWDAILSEQLPAFAKPMTQVQFEQHLLQLNAAIEDTHGGIVAIKQPGQVYGSYFPPFVFRFAGDSIVVTDYIDSVSCIKQDILKGDVIVGIQGKSIAKALAGVDNYVSASNAHRKKSMLAAIPLLLPFRGNDSIMTIRLLRNKQGFDRQLILQKPVQKEFVNRLNRLYAQQTGNGTTTQNRFVLRSLDKDIVQVDAANLSILYNSSADDREIDSVMKEMVMHKKAILLDLRCYTTQAVFYNKFLSALGWKLKPFAVLQAHDTRFPGKYYVQDIFTPVVQPPLASPYPGKLILLVDERTQSQSELITMVLQASGPAIVVGSQTAGCDGDLINLPIPGGYTLSFSGRHVAYPDGTASQKLGIKRNLKIDHTTKGIAAGKDEIMEAALRILK
jgi:carboxyl-terminal processing protease